MAGKGQPKTGGRGKGTPNKVTQEFRDAVKSLLEDNSENLSRWLTLVAEGDGTEKGKPDPGRALDLISKLAEYASPKLARIEGHVTPGAEKSHEEWLRALD